jgi:hypothetical protein
VLSASSAGALPGTPGLAPGGVAVYTDDDDDGRDLALEKQRPTVLAYFPRESYAAGTVARLVIIDKASRVTYDVRHAGTEEIPVKANNMMAGKPVTPSRSIGAVSGRRVVAIRIGNWPSGVYFAQLTAPGGRIGYAPFVLRPKRLGEHRVAVVMPTQTWQAYNWRDDDGNGTADTWYAHPGRHARLARPFLSRGTPPHFKYYEIPWLRWLVQTHHDADMLSDLDLNRVKSGKRLANEYSLLIFSGHHEYVTTHEYGVISDYRNHGGNLMFLSANNFFWKITKRGNVMTRVAQWRDLGRPESALLGTQYFHNDEGQHGGPWIVRKPLHWLFDGTGLRKGSAFGHGGIEADHVTNASPRSTTVVAEIPNLYGPGLTAQMTYYETKAGAKVFAAGAFTLAGSIDDPPVERLIDNLWKRMANDEPGR